MKSELVVFEQASPHRTVRESDIIDHVAIHCVVGQCTAEALGALFAAKSTMASSNYGVDKDGRVGMYVDETYRAWTTGGVDVNKLPIRVNGISGSDIDHRAITIEVASDSSAPYAINEAAYEGLINLLVDICKRYPTIGKLRWQGDKSLVGQPDKQNIAVHRWFAYKSCPGDYIYDRLGEIAEEVNRRLGLDERDNEPSKWKGAKEAVDWAKENGIMQGNEKGNLRLRDNITREEMCVMLHRMWSLAFVGRDDPGTPDNE